MGYAIGIDIGTANTRVAVFRDDQVEIIPDKDGRRSMPSYIAFMEEWCLFGNASEAHAASNPKNTVNDVKCVLGQRRGGWPGPVDRYTRFFHYDVSLETSEQVTISVQVFGMLLAQARANAEAYLGDVVESAVISVPRHFDRLHRLDVHDAARSAGLNVLYMNTSIESLALYYAFATRQDESICVFLDLGAGSFTAGLVEIKKDIIKVLSDASDKDIGGEALIDRIYSHLAAEVQRKWDYDPNTIARIRHRLRTACERAMRKLSSEASTQFEITSFYNGQDFSGQLSRETLEQLCQDLFHATLNTIDWIFNKTRMQDKSSVKDIVIVGGCSRIPKLQEVWSNYFDSKPLVQVVNPDEGEVLGSAVHAAILASGQSPDSANFLMLLGNAPLAVGLKTEGGMMRTVIPRNTTIPTKKTEIYQVSDFNLVPGESPTLHFYQGNRKRARNNLFIGTLDLSELLPRWNHGNSKTQIQITTDIDAQQRVTASAVVEGKSTSPTAWQMVLHRSSGQLGKLIAQAKAYEEDDAMEEALVAQRCALDLRLASMGEIQPSDFQTKRMVDLLNSLSLLRNWLDRLESGNFADYLVCHRRLDGLDRELKIEKLRGGEIMGLRSHAEELRTKLLATTQTPKIESLLQSVRSVTQWVEQNEEAEIQEYKAKLDSLMAISVELVSLSEAPPSPESTPNIGTPQPPEAGTRAQMHDPRRAQMNGPRRLDELSSESGWDARSKYTDSEFEDVASYLCNTDHERWSKVPRIYTVLRLIDRVELVDTFLRHDMTDIWFPFSDNTLPNALKQPHRAQFLQIQEVVFSKALELERGVRLDGKKYRKHAHFSHGESLPFRVIGNLGSGIHGFVDKVVSALSYKEYARKRFKRHAINTRSGIHKREVKTFLNEVNILKTLRNRHCIDMVGSYSDPQHFALLMYPVAECNLEMYYSLALADRDKRSILQGFFGCLAGTLDYLHSQKVVHQDIKPQNILVKDNNHVLVTDFGIARSWEGLTRATTTAELDRTWLYAAPEVARGGPKNETADVWSLGCVFLEMCTVLKGQSPADMGAFFKGRSDSTSFHDNAAPGHITAWVESLRDRSPSEVNEALEWVGKMLQVEPSHRCRAFELFDSIVVTSTSTGVLFCAACCRDRGDSALDSNDEDLDRWSEGDDEDV